MNTQPKYTTKGPGDLSGPDDPQNATDSMVDCPGTMWEWLHEAGNAALLAEFGGAALVIALDYTGGFRDARARERRDREMDQLTQRIEEEVAKAEQAEREANDEMRDWYGRKRA